MKKVEIGSVRPFPGVEPTKEQALKALEEAAEAFGAWQEWHDSDNVHEFGYLCDRVMQEIADTIQACANLAASMNVFDLSTYMAECERRNIERGRYEA